MFKAAIHIYLCLDQQCSVNLAKRVELPFLPVPGMALGLEPESDFRENRHDVEQVMYRVPEAELLVRVAEVRIHCDETYEQFLDTVRWYIEGGWSLELEYPWESADEADAVDPGTMYIARVGGSYYCMDRVDVDCLKIQGVAVEVVKEPAPEYR